MQILSNWHNISPIPNSVYKLKLNRKGKKKDWKHQPDFTLTLTLAGELPDKLF